MLFIHLDEQSGYKVKQVGLVLLSDNVIEALPDAQVTALDRLWSDHNPILFHCSKSDYGLTPFRLYHSWFNRDGFDELISSEWNSFSQNSNNQSLLSHEKLKGLKAKFKVWLRDTKNIEQRHKEEVLVALKNLDVKIDSNTASLEDRESRTKLLHEIDKINRLETLDLHQKSRIKWDIEGDENSKFFHGLVNQRRRTNSIHDIMSDGMWVTNPLQVKETFLNFFKEKFQPYDSMIDLPSITFPSNLSSSDHDILKKDVTLEEIKSSVWDCGNDKAPEPDGFTFGFIKRYWELLKNDIMEFVTRFLETKKIPMGSNSSFITLIPKVSNPIHIKDYRPISLIYIHYKIIAKVLANRLAKVVDKIVSQEQSASTLGRQILDGPLILSEMIDCWKYLDYMLYNLGFGLTWRSWIKACLESSRTSILVNESPTSEFSIKHGLRQGDPLSPFLFIIVIEGLHMALSEASHSGLIHGIKIGSSNITLSHIFYADDVVITTYWSPLDMDNIIRVLQVFYFASGLKINIHKSNVYGVGVSDNEVHSMANNIGCSSGSFPFIYLGLPIGANMNLMVSWKVLLDRFDARLSKWKANLLSIGGHLTLIKLVLGSLRIYYLSIFKVPESVLKLLEKKIASFFWGGNHDVKVFKAFHGQEGGFGLNENYSNGIWSKIVGSSNYLHSNAILPSDSIRLFWLEQDKDCFISDRFKDNQWTWNWSRSIIGDRHSAYLKDIINEISLTEFSSERDVCYWSIANDDMFSVISTRQHIDSHFLFALDIPSQWNKSIPRKVNIFMWRFMLDRLPHRLNLSSHGIDIPTIGCPSCNGNVESSNHIFFGCGVANYIWSNVRNWCDITFPSCSSFDHWKILVPRLLAENKKEHRELAPGCESGTNSDVRLCRIALRYRCARTELVTPDLTCPSTYQLLRNSGGDSRPDLSFDKSASPERLFRLARVSLAESSKLLSLSGCSGGDYTSSCPPNL
ncbi:putative RNA-directed DNA polymerase, eukaryota, reverse transcriptase zinc-binding domain protein [Tanacetum coccineum]